MIYTPTRVQLSRKKGWRMPPNTVKVDRSTKWGNTWRVALAQCRCTTPCNSWFCVGDTAEAVRAFARWRRKKARHDPKREAEYLAPLRGKNLACWCPLDQPCHADVLLEMAAA